MKKVRAAAGKYTYKQAVSPLNNTIMDRLHSPIQEQSNSSRFSEVPHALLRRHCLHIDEHDRVIAICIGFLL